MKGAESKAPDLFSNASLLSMLSRSQSSTRSNVKGVVPPTQDKSARKKTEKEITSSSAVNRKLSPPPSTNRYLQKESTERISNGPNIYQIGAEIGRGAFAVVYQAFNVETGDFVAVKRFPLTAIDDESLSSIQSEIELMQRLNHPNIVKYIDTIRTERYLYIVIEYIENGSLSTVLKKFGSFSEPLVAIYVTQILRGLKYLHEQGALHRDIKGANILTTKDGLVKLADFGVAIKLTEGSNLKRKGSQEDSQDVVGSPYWIAPEIIEMATPTAACDIWSVGCTIIELLTGKPPYYSRAPMAALFSIVQDPHPPLPDGISTPIKDFLLLCFQKEPSMRSSAAVLLSHPWLQQAVQVHSSPKKQTSPKSHSDTKNCSPILSSAVNSPLSSKNSEAGDSRCAFAESSPPADRSDRNRNHEASFSDTVISPRYEMSPRFLVKEELDSPEQKHINDSGKDLLPQVESETSTGLETLNITTDLNEEVTEAKDAISKSNIKVNSAGLGSSLVGLFDSDGDTCPVPRGVALRRNSANLNDRSDRSSVTRMMSFELPDEREGSSGWNSLDSVDNGTAWSPVKMLSKKQMSSVTVSCSSLLPSRPLSSSQSSANGSAFEDDEDEVESTKVRAARSLPMPRRYSIRSQNALSSVYSEDRTLQDRDEDSLNDMRLSIDDEVDERRGLYILRKALKSSNFLDHDATPDESEGEGNLLPPKLRLSLDQPHGLQGEDGLDTNSLDLELNMRIRQTDSRSVASYDGFDDITTVLDIDDDEYFEGTDSKDVHMNRSREIVTIMGRISSNCEKKEATASCSKLLDIFSMYPDIKDHLMTHFGATPILEMFEATQSCPQTLMSHLEIRPTRSSSVSTDSTGGGVTNSSEFTADVLRVVNKVMEGSIRCQEELTMMGILPGVMRLLHDASRAIAGVKSREKLVTTPHTKLPSYTALAFSSFLSHSMLSAQSNVDHSKAVIEIDQSAMEAARFIHLICSSSSLTLQILVGAGGLSTLVHMISFSALMSTEGGDSPKKSTAAAAKVVTDTALIECKSEEPVALAFSKARNSAPNAPEDAKLMVYMGVDCVTEILLEQSSRARDFCRLFVKLGLLRHISRAFDCINSSVKRTPKCCSPSCHAFQKKRWGGTSGTSRCSSLPCLKGHERKPSDMSDFSGAVKSASLSLVSTECNLECGYLNNISNILLKFSRSDATVALRMAGDSELIQTMMAVLRDPGLSNPLWSSCGKASASSTESKTSHESGSTVGTNKPAERRRLIDFNACGITPCSADIVETLLKCLKNLSMESNALADLEKAGTISILIPLLDGPLSDRCKNHIVPCIFNLCRINKRRQEEAAVHGVIPHLQTLIVNDSHLKQYALPILCSLAYTSPITRAELLRHGGAAFYINLLKEAYWQTFALNSLAVWLANDTEYMENLLVEPTHLARLVDFFRTASPQTIRVLHNPFLDMMSKSCVLSKALSSSGLYVTSLVKRLSTSDAIVLRSLLKMVQLLHQYHPNPRHFVLDNDLYNVAKGFAQSEGQVLVHQVANRLLIDFQNSTLT